MCTIVFLLWTNRSSEVHFAVLGAIVGAFAGVAVQAAFDTYNGELSGVDAYAGAAVGGALAGATAGLASGAGLGVYGTAVTSGAVGNVSAALLKMRSMDSHQPLAAIRKMH